MGSKTKFLTIILIIALFAGVYFWYSSKNSKIDSSVLVSENLNNDEINAQEKEVLRLLFLIQTIKFDSGFLDNIVFKTLNDRSVQLPEPEIGRVNPFAPL